MTGIIKTNTLGLSDEGKMHKSSIFNAKFLKFKYDKVYFLLLNELNNNNFEDNNYYIDIDDILNKGSYNFNEKEITYEILSFNENEISISINCDKELSDDELVFMYYNTEKHITGNKENIEDIKINDLLNIY